MPFICKCSLCSKMRCQDQVGKLHTGQYKSRTVQLKHLKQDHDLQPPQPELDNDDEIESHLSALKTKLKEHHWDLNYEKLQDDNSKGSTTGKSLCLTMDHERDRFFGWLPGPWFFSVFTIVCLFLMWLHLFYGPNHIKVWMVCEFIMKIIRLAQENPLLANLEHCRVPKDIRTTTKKLSITPELGEQMCCPVCFSLYTPVTAPWVYTYKPTARAQ